MDYALLNTIGITIIALVGLWIFSISAVHRKNKSTAESKKEPADQEKN